MAARHFATDPAWVDASTNQRHARQPHARPGGRAPLGPVAESVLTLQAAAGNAAIAGALKAGVPLVQRQPKKPPAYVAAAQATFKQLFPKEKLMQGVVIKDYADLNPALQGADYGAWTQSASEIYLRDPALFADTKATQDMAAQYILQHEANHVRQFAKAKGPPKTWETMAKYELEAYTNDVKWLNGPGKSIVTDATLHKKLLDGATTNLADVKTILKGAGKLKGRQRETYFIDAMLDKKLIPDDSTDNPLDLYKQP